MWTAVPSLGRCSHEQFTRPKWKPAEATREGSKLKSAAASEGYPRRTLAALPPFKESIRSGNRPSCTAVDCCWISLWCFSILNMGEKKKTLSLEISTYLWWVLPLFPHDASRNHPRVTHAVQEFPPAGTCVATFLLHPFLINNPCIPRGRFLKFN